MTTWSRTTRPPGRAMNPGAVGFDRIEGLGVDVPVGGSPGQHGGIDADPFDRAPIELRLAFVVCLSSADRLAKIGYGVGWKNEPRRAAQRVRRYEPERLPVSNAPPSSDGVPLEQASARGSAVACDPVVGRTRRARNPCGGAWSTQISLGPCVTTHPKSVEVHVPSHLICMTVPMGGVSAASALARKLGELLHGAVKRSATAAAIDSAAEVRTRRLRPDALATTCDREVQERARIGARRRREALALDR